MGVQFYEDLGLWYDEDDFQVEDDELDCDQVVVYVEFYVCVFEGFEVVFIW